MQLQTVDDDLLDQDADVIVNAWNRNIIPWWLLLRAHGARVGSLFGWPFGCECRITFDQPIGRDAVVDLAVLNSLTSRHWVGVAFNYDIADVDLEHARDILQKCHVFRVDLPGRLPGTENCKLKI